jgi:hypothetical protein
MNLVDRILTRAEFQNSPPVVVDIGASGGLNPAWRAIRRHSVCIAFDGDDSGLKNVPRASGAYKRLHVYNLLVTADRPGSADFYFTKSATCSSLLPPNQQQLSEWAFADRFQVLEKREVKTTNLTTILAELGLKGIDWFKSDSQGTDLRLFASLGDPVLSRVLVAEFEPGILDAYQGEDKLWQVLAFMEGRDFWMSDMRIKGSQWLRSDLMKDFAKLEKQLAPLFLKRSPGWGEIAYLNCFRCADFTARDFLLGWVFAFLLKQYGFALQLAVTARDRFDDPVFDDLQAHAISMIRLSYFRPSAYFDLMQRLAARIRRHS